MRLFSAEYLRALGTDLFVGCGASQEDADVVASELVEASLMGLDSHGVVRYVQYVEDALNGQISPQADIRIIKETANTAIVDCEFAFGPVAAVRAVEIACRKAEQVNVAYVVTHNCNHVGRLGSYVQKIAERGMFAFATCNSSKHGHFVVPWEGAKGRLATNPLAYAAPTSGRPVVMDMSTAAISEGKIRVLMNRGEPVPTGSVMDARGNPTTNPREFYGPPRGAILPFGGQFGYKAFGLSLLVEVMSAAMAGVGSSVDLPYVNGLALVVVDPDAFCGRTEFRELMDGLSVYISSSPSALGQRCVVMPGFYDFQTLDRRSIEGIPVDDRTWEQICQTALRVGVAADGRLCRLRWLRWRCSGMEHRLEAFSVHQILKTLFPPTQRKSGSDQGVKIDIATTQKSHSAIPRAPCVTHRALKVQLLFHDLIEVELHPAAQQTDLSVAAHLSDHVKALNHRGACPCTFEYDVRTVAFGHIIDVLSCILRLHINSSVCAQPLREIEPTCIGRKSEHHNPRSVHFG